MRNEQNSAMRSARTMDRRTILSLSAALGASLAAPAGALAKQASEPTKPENVLSPEQALERLMQGNRRYVNGVMRRHDFHSERKLLTGGQNPYAGILGCSDSRIGPEYAFDVSRGDIFVVRVAGNFVNEDNLASMEYTVAILKTPLLMVLGHDACGAIKSTISSIESKTTLPGHLPALVASLTPAVDAAQGHPGDLLETATRENVRLNVERLKSATPILSAAVEEKRLKVVGAIYRLSDGHVEIVA